MKNISNHLEIEIRKGTVDDVPLLLSFIREMAEFEKLEVTATEEIMRESLFGDKPSAYTLFACVDNKPVAYAVYFYTYSTMVGKRGLWLEDVFVKPEFRKNGIAKAIMAYLANIAILNNCGRFEWMVLDWNKTAIDFYKKLGAKQLNGWQTFRINENDIIKVIKHPGTTN